MPRDRMRAAVRCARLIPSPMKRMTLRAFRGPVPNTCQVTVRVILPSVAATVYAPGLSRLMPRRISAEASTFGSVALNCAARPNTAAGSRPSIVILASDSATTPSNSTLRSNCAPARISARSTGYTVSAAAAPGASTARPRQTAARAGSGGRAMGASSVVSGAGADSGLASFLAADRIAGPLRNDDNAVTIPWPRLAATSAGSAEAPCRLPARGGQQVRTAVAGRHQDGLGDRSVIGDTRHLVLVAELARAAHPGMKGARR